MGEKEFDPRHDIFTACKNSLTWFAQFGTLLIDPPEARLKVFSQETNVRNTLGDVHQTEKRQLLFMSPETQPERSIISVVGWCSSNKTETTRALTAHLNQLEGDDQRSVFFFSVGGAFRLLSGFPDIPLDTPEAIHASAKAALSLVHTEVDAETGEIVLKPNGTDVFKQSHANGLAGSRLGANPHMAAFVREFVLDLIDTHVPMGKTVIVEGREQYGAGDQDTLLRIYAKLPFRAALYPLERAEAKDWDFERVVQVIAERDAFDASILAPALEVTRHVIEVERTEVSCEATMRVVERVGGMIYQYKHEGFPTGFETQPIHVDDRSPF